MKTLLTKRNHLSSHNWKDIGGFTGLLLDGAFFAFLLVVAFFVLMTGAFVVVLDYAFSAVVGTMSLFHRTRSSDKDDAVLLENGTLGHQRDLKQETLPQEPEIDLNWQYYL